MSDQYMPALERMVRAVEGEDELLSNSGTVWEAYVQAREALGDPVKDFPGGWEDTHFHPYGWTAADGCDTCDDDHEERKVEQRQAAVESQGVSVGSAVRPGLVIDGDDHESA